MNQRILLALILSSFSIPTCFAETAPPNIVLVFVDDHAFEAISAYGTHLKDHAKTRTIDRLGKEGMRFDHFTCNISICSPSRASTLTGQYGHRNGVTGLGGKINDDSPHFPAELQKAGYETFLVGKWHLGSQPKGFDKHMTVKGQGKYFDPKFTGTEGAWSKKGYSTDIYTDIAMEWLKDRDQEKPFLLCLHFKAPHHEYGHAARYDDLLSEVPIPEPVTLYDDPWKSNSALKKGFVAGSKFHMSHAGEGSYYERHLKDPEPDAMWEHDPQDEQDRIRVAYQHMMHKYIRCISGNDDNLKRVLDYLDGEQLTDDTIVIYTSDQGYWLGQHGFYDKRLILETSMRMPFLIRYPRMIEPGSVNNDLCINVDIGPTLLDLADVDIPEAMQGRSMVPLLKKESVKDWRNSAFFSYYGAPNHYGVRTKNFTYVKMIGAEAELYDRTRDPHQRTNVAPLPEYKQVMAELDQALTEQIQNIDIEPSRLPSRSISKSKSPKKRSKR